MSQLGDALALLERAVARLEAASLADAGRAEAKAAAAAARIDGERVAEVATAIVARVEAALGKIGQALDPVPPPAEE